LQQFFQWNNLAAFYQLTRTFVIVIGPAIGADERA